MTVNNRRTFLVTLTSSLSFVATANAASATTDSVYRTCPRPSGGPNAYRFPRVVVQDHDKRKAWFYEDLIAGKLALVSFTSVAMEKKYPILANLTAVQALLADRLGKDVFMYTLTTEPHRDGPEQLKRLAEDHGARWRFLTGDVPSFKQVLRSFNVRGRLSGLLWIGNERTGRWVKRPCRQAPSAIAEVVARLSVGEHFRPLLADRHSARPGISRPEERRRLKKLILSGTS